MVKHLPSMCKAVGSILNSNKATGQHMRMMAAILASQHHFSLKSQLVPLSHCLPALGFGDGSHSLRLSLLPAVSGSLLSPPQARRDPAPHALTPRAAPNPAHSQSPGVAAHGHASFVPTGQQGLSIYVRSV